MFLTGWMNLSGLSACRFGVAAAIAMLMALIAARLAPTAYRLFLPLFLVAVHIIVVDGSVNCSNIVLVRDKCITAP
jgi:membrane-bound ClpP family serine protease